MKFCFETKVMFYNITFNIISKCKLFFSVFFASFSLQSILQMTLYLFISVLIAVKLGISEKLATSSFYELPYYFSNHTSDISSMQHASLFLFVFPTGDFCLSTVAQIGSILLSIQLELLVVRHKSYHISNRMLYEEKILSNCFPPLKMLKRIFTVEYINYTIPPVPFYTIEPVPFYG